MGSQEITFLLGAGASMPAGLPGTAAITDRVIAGNDIWRHTDQRFYLGTSPGPSLLPGDRAVIEWLVSPEDKRMVVVHPDPVALASGSRYAIGSKWAGLESAGKLVTVAKGIEQVNWAPVKALL